MSIHQTTASAVPPVRAYKNLGFQGGPGLYSLRNLFGMIVGEQNSGKSYLFQSCPDAFIINLDLSSTVSPHAKCVVWPGIGADGRPIDVDGKPLIMTWDHVEAKIKQLCDMAKNGDERPSMVVIDTMIPMLRLLKPWVARQMGKELFEQAHGPAAWERLYDTVIDVAHRLRSHGYGVWLLAHLSRDWVEIGEGSKVEEHYLSLPPGLRERLSKVVEIIAPMRSEVRETTIVEPTVVTVAGKQVTQNRTVSKQTITRTIAFRDPRYLRLIRTRTLKPMPDIDVTGAAEPWVLFEEAYKTANTP